MIVPHLPREVFPEYYLVRVNAYDKIHENPFDEWMTYLKTGKIKDDTRTPGLQQFKEKLSVLAMTPKELRAYDDHIDAIKAQNDVLDNTHEEGRAEGRAKGRAEAILDVSRAMKHQGMAPEDICKLTCLELEEDKTL